MTAATSRLRRRGIGAGVAALVGLSGLGLSAAIPAQALASFDLTRPADTTNRYATAASVATAAFTTSTNVIIANGDNAVDALSASYLAGTTTPILYVKASGVPAETAAAITKLGATNAWVVGGTTAIPASVYSAIGTATKTRIDGADRYKTAVAVGAAKAAQGTKPTTAFLARGDQFADALAIAPVAAKSGIPVLLTQTGSLNADTLAALKAWGITNVTVIGGPAAVSEGVRTSLTAEGITSTRIAGGTRTSTAVDIANTASFGFAKTGVYLVNGLRPVDALPAAIAAAKANAPIILTGDGVLGTDASSYLAANASTLAGGVAVGGTTAIPTSVETAAETAGGAQATNQTITVTPNTAVSQTVQNEGGTTPTADDRSYTASGLTAGTTYRITLVNAASIVTAANGSVTFLSSTDANSASGYSVDPGTDIADITSVNNATPTFATADASAARTTTVQPVNGSITFTVDGTAPGSIVPVVYINGGAGGTATTGGVSARLETSATASNLTAAATESFGFGGAVTYTAPLAAGGAVTGTFVAGSSGPVVITSVDKTANSFNTTLSGVTSRYTFDANDRFTVGTASVGFDAFKAALSSGDGVSGTFAVDPGGISDFTLVNSNPSTPAAPTFTVGTGANSNDVTLTTVLAGDVDAVQIERAPVSNGTIGTYAVIATPTSDADSVAANFQYVDNDVPAGVYNYRVSFVNDGNIGPSTAAGTNTTTTSPSAADTTAPTLVDTRLTTSGGLSGTLDAGDTVTLVFSEAVAVPATAVLRVRDADGSIGNINIGSGGNASATQPGSAQTIGGVSVPANRIITVAISGAITTSAAGTTPDIQIPATIIDQASFVDGAGNALNIAGSTDAVIDVES